MQAFSRAPIAAGAVVLCGVLMSFETLAFREPGTAPPGAPRTLDLNAVPMTINEPGTYVVRHNWDFSATNPSGPPGYTAITVMASDVVIDFAGYQIKFAEYGGGVKIKGNNVTLRNGTLLGGGYSRAVASSGVSTEIDNMSISSSFLSSTLLGSYAHVHDSEINGGLVLGDYALIERNVVQGKGGSITVANDTFLQGNRFQSHGDYLVKIGSRNTMIDNVAENIGRGGGFNNAFWVAGNRNTILRNTVMVQDELGHGFDVDGTANILDANVVLPTEYGPVQAGITFRQAGNFYGNNRVAAQTPFNLGGVPQIDWGGNVGYSVMP